MKTIALCLSLFVSLARAAEPPLAGVWLKDGLPYAELRADGSGRVDADKVAWKADGKTIVLSYADGSVERVSYSLRGSQLTLELDGKRAVLVRQAPGKARAKPRGGRGKDELSALLLSSAWCHFSYNKVSGASRQERVVFGAEGTWSSGARAESYSSGAYGSVAGQSDSGSGGRWKAEGGKLLMSQGSGELQDTGLEVSRNSNGSPILSSSGKEYSMCR